MLSLEHVSKVYHTRRGRHKVLSDVNMQLARGGNLGIVGRNGAGKSTLIRLIAGAERPSSGIIRRTMSVSWPLAFAGAFQSHLTGLDNLKFVARTYGVDWRTLRPFVEDFTELGVYFKEPVIHYSNGMLTRLAFALSMAIEFDCFLIDEAMVVGDVRFHERCHVELFVKRKDRAFILVTHEAEVIKLYCQNACVLHDGQLLPFPSVDAALEFYNATMAARPEPVEV